MAAEISFLGGELTLKIQHGSTVRTTYTGCYDASDNLITNFTAVRLAIREGGPDDLALGDVVLALTGTPTANDSSVTTDGTAITVNISPDDTQTIPANADHWYQIEADDANGDTWTIGWGSTRTRWRGAP